MRGLRDFTIAPLTRLEPYRQRTHALDLAEIDPLVDRVRLVLPGAEG